MPFIFFLFRFALYVKHKSFFHFKTVFMKIDFDFNVIVYLSLISTGGLYDDVRNLPAAKINGSFEI